MKDLLRSRMVKWPKRLAFFTDREALSTRQFEQRVRPYVAALRSLGIERGDRVVVIANKSIAATALLFACIEADAIFVPLDPAMPEERMRHALADCLPSLVIAIDVGQGRLDGPALLELREEIAAGEEGESVRWFRPSRAQRAGALASLDPGYIMYTSGSTGEPKGVYVELAALESFLHSAVARAGYHEETRFLSFFPLHFDPALMEIFAPWLSGGSTYLFGTFRFVTDLVGQLGTHRITDFSCTPSVVSMMLSKFSRWTPSATPDLRSIWFGGEKANPRHVAAMRASMPSLRLFNGYGPTEAVVACSLHEVGETIAADIPIGTPMTGSSFRLVDAALVPVPDGTEGELLLGGEQLMRGYFGSLRAGDLLDGFVVLEGERLYRTGDRVVFRDGEYHFLGRLSTMIKRRGYRLFPEEVERALCRADSVVAACVIYDETRDRLCGHVEIHTSATSEDTELMRERLLLDVARSLPSYMVPDELNFSSELPRTSGGKIDVRSLRNLTEGP
ncbi:MAG: hypothetical protein JWN04_1411 [Myxococcaceae bacterium]|nr:hypothetical protein [Myxococcaceae bacterium]